jgi:anti-sigma factor RsiW
MNGLVLRFTKSAHQTTQELLPWHITGALAADESEMVERHLQSCPICRTDSDRMRVVRTAYVGRDVPLDPERLLNTMRTRLMAEAAQQPKSRARTGAGLGDFWSRHTGWMRLGLALQFGVILALGWVVWTEPARVEYRTLTSASPTAGDLIVAFDPNTTLRDVTRILRASGARVVQGPTASNSYVLSVDRDRLPAALVALRAEPTVVLVEPLQGPARP